MTVAKLLPEMSQEEWAKCRQILRLCVASAMLVDLAEDLASKHEELPLAELYNAIERVHVELRDVTLRLLNDIVQRITKAEVEDSDEMKYFIYVRLAPVAVTREGLLKIADEAKIVHDLLCV